MPRTICLVVFVALPLFAAACAGSAGAAHSPASGLNADAVQPFVGVMEDDYRPRAAMLTSNDCRDRWQLAEATAKASGAMIYCAAKADHIQAQAQTLAGHLQPFPSRLASAVRKAAQSLDTASGMVGHAGRNGSEPEFSSALADYDVAVQSFCLPIANVNTDIPWASVGVLDACQ